ncbi:MAG: DUF4388 domain-containing protein [Acidobacteriota bacterium]
MRLEGRIEDFDLLEVLQAALRQREPSQLLVAAEELEGLLTQRGGCIVDARWDKLQGEDAVFTLLAQQRGFFSLSRLEGAQATAIEGSFCWTWPQLLSESMRRASTAGDPAQAPLDAGDRELLARDLLILLKNLGGDVAALADEQGGGVALLTGLCDLVNMSVSLAPDQAKRLEFQLADVLPRHGWKGVGASFVQLNGSLADVQGLTAIYAAAAFDPESRSREARATAHTLAASLREILTHLIGLADAENSTDLAARSESVSSDLDALIRASQF